MVDDAELFSRSTSRATCSAQLDLGSVSVCHACSLQPSQLTPALKSKFTTSHVHRRYCYQISVSRLSTSTPFCSLLFDTRLLASSFDIAHLSSHFLCHKVSLRIALYKEENWVAFRVREQVEKNASASRVCCVFPPSFMRSHPSEYWHLGMPTLRCKNLHACESMQTTISSARRVKVIKVSISRIQLLPRVLVTYCPNCSFLINNVDSYHISSYVELNHSCLRSDPCPLI